MTKEVIQDHSPPEKPLGAPILHFTGDTMKGNNTIRMVATGSIPPIGEEQIIVDPVTGAKKGSKIERFDLIPPDVLRMLARHYGRGAEKYGERNMEKGYKFSLGYAALQRHANAWWEGEDNDPEFKTSHLLAVIWHAITLLWMTLHGKGTDDRSKSGW